MDVVGRGGVTQRHEAARGPVAQKIRRDLVGCDRLEAAQRQQREQEGIGRRAELVPPPDCHLRSAPPEVAPRLSRNGTFPTIFPSLFSVKKWDGPVANFHPGTIVSSGLLRGSNTVALKGGARIGSGPPDVDGRSKPDRGALGGIAAVDRRSARCDPQILASRSPGSHSPRGSPSRRMSSRPRASPISPPTCLSSWRRSRPLCSPCAGSQRAFAAAAGDEAGARGPMAGREPRAGRTSPALRHSGIMVSLLVGMILNVPVRSAEYLAAMPPLPAVAPRGSPCSTFR